MSYLLDVNVLIARSDPNHQFHAHAAKWFQSIGNQIIVTCPIVENGFVRIFGHPNYTGGPGSIKAAIQHLRLIRSLPQHRFIEDHLSLDSPKVFDTFDEVSSKQLTDIYLLGLAVEKDQNFATFDQRIDSAKVVNGSHSIFVVPS